MLFSSIHSFNEAVEAGRYLDRQYGGQGRYEHDIFEGRSIDSAKGTIAKFREFSPKNGVDAEQALEEFGYVPPLEISDAAKEWIRQPEEAPAVESTPDAQGEEVQMSMFSKLPIPDQRVEPEMAQSSEEIKAKIPELDITKQIAPPEAQSGKAERFVAQLLHEAGLAQELLKEDDFHLKVENDSYIPLVVERHSDHLNLTHYLKDQSGELYIDSEMVFSINEGKLKLEQTAIQNPFGGGEVRGLDPYVWGNVCQEYC